ncbi:MAG: tRNA (guanosine(46)-N7)-methyltransferase TrmB [Buchnera aphidicola (Pentalonia nigronervosa)]|jgi:tRNA (guanine-N7-)-methyltransferase|uniref:tRNA (guanine-N(7)-)-methyltransferase n=1 Tax=Buchnera aphidicola (Pentalonia nigronervosa) TaxID=1309793 RepID=A0A7H1AZ17_9GAMM|nr:MAG: tRNA (guanosine(46)-N7)-methyltransferase TrmB [Buchnera aphidicola (Pentalonia nigronervosa)]
MQKSFTPHCNDHGIFLRRVRSFVCRTGRITKSQLQGIKKHWLFMGIDFEHKLLNFFSVFNSSSEVVLEIGFGSGHSLVHNAVNHPDKNFLGIEVYKSGIGSCLNLAYSKHVKNLRIIYYDAVEVINNMISDRTLSIIQIFFPDPWPKKRHHKRRLIQKEFLSIIAKRMIIGGILYIITDSEEYSCHIKREINQHNMYTTTSQDNYFLLSSSSHITTKFEKKAHVQGNQIFHLMFKVIC